MRVRNFARLPSKRQGQGWRALLQEGADAVDTRAKSFPLLHRNSTNVSRNESFFHGHGSDKKWNHRSLDLCVHMSCGRGIFCRNHVQALPSLPAGTCEQGDLRMPPRLIRPVSLLSCRVLLRYRTRSMQKVGCHKPSVTVSQR